MYKTVISTSALHDGRTADWVIVDCRFDLQNEDWGRAQYEIAHIPGAIYAHVGHDLSAPMTGRNGRHPWPDVQTMTSTFGRMGIGPGTQVIVYDQDIGMFASRLWWMLRAMGHEAVAVLDGGWTAWTREGRATVSGAEIRPATTFFASPRPELLVDAAEVEASLPDRTLLLVDARAPERFEGRSETLDPVAGHIPGAVNRFFRTNVDENGLMRSPEALRAEFLETAGGRPPEQVVMYCGSGVTACHNLLALEHAGLGGARLYAGSWSEWCADPRRPVATGS